MEVKIIGRMDNTIDHTFESANRVYDKNQLCPTIPTCGGGGIQPKVIEETRCVGGLNDKQSWKTIPPARSSYKYIVAMRGRNTQNSTDRTPGAPTKQRLEVNMNGTSNTLTTVQKDNLVLEQDCGETEYRIRKLTPKECWRLMGYTDKDFDNAQKAGVSNSQLYKQAGNAIVKQVLMAIFMQMHPKLK